MISPRSTLLLLALWLAVVYLFINLAACGGAQPVPETLVQERCTKCHTLAPIEVSHRKRQDWETTVYRMIEKGARLNHDQAQVVIDYLSKTYGPEQ
jgi:hypothetical protein